jgi:hypothetical protein
LDRERDKLCHNLAKSLFVTDECFPVQHGMGCEDGTTGDRGYDIQILKRTSPEVKSQYSQVEKRRAKSTPGKRKGIWRRSSAVCEKLSREPTRTLLESLESRLKQLIARNIEVERPKMKCGLPCELVLTFFTGLSMEHNLSSSRPSIVRKIDDLMKHNPDTVTNHCGSVHEFYDGSGRLFSARVAAERVWAH